MPKEEPKEEPSWAPSAGVPKYDAPPSEVRKFIIDILHKHHEVDIQDAAKIAAKWTYSRGYDFLNYDIPRMNGILGENYGGIMRAHTRPVQYASDYEKELRKLRIQAGLCLDMSREFMIGVGLLICLVWVLFYFLG